MFLALVGAVTCLICLSRVHDRSLARLLGSAAPTYRNPT
jgi:hypothetical protein